MNFEEIGLGEEYVVIFHFFDMVKMDGIYLWHFPIGSAHDICFSFSYENNKIRFLESPSSLLKRMGARHLDHPIVYVLLYICSELGLTSSTLIPGRKPCNDISVMDAIGRGFSMICMSVHLCFRFLL